MLTDPHLRIRITKKYLTKKIFHTKKQLTFTRCQFKTIKKIESWWFYCISKKPWPIIVTYYIKLIKTSWTYCIPLFRYVGSRSDHFNMLIRIQGPKKYGSETLVWSLSVCTTYLSIFISLNYSHSNKLKFFICLNIYYQHRANIENRGWSWFLPM